jgi:hypothetical protein
MRGCSWAPRGRPAAACKCGNAPLQCYLAHADARVVERVRLMVARLVALGAQVVEVGRP